MTNELILAWAQLFTFALFIEGATEAIPHGLRLIPFFGQKILDRVDGKQLVFVIAISTTMIFKYGVLQKIVGITAETQLAQWTDYILTGLIVSRGSEFIHAKFEASVQTAKAIKAEAYKKINGDGVKS